jgi:CSLREA domain-containing protein
LTPKKLGAGRLLARSPADQSIFVISLSPYRAIFFVLVFAAEIFIGNASASAATITVTTTADSGPGSLRDALATATSGDTIDFDGSLAGQTIGLSTVGDSTYGPSALLINKQLTITGLTGNSGITIARTSPGPMRLFYIDPTGILTLRNLTLANGWAKGGDGGGPNGGNSEGGGGGAAGLGGAIYNQGVLSIDQSTLSGNKAEGGKGGSGSGNNFTAGGGGGGLNGDGQAANSDVTGGAGGAGGGGTGGVGGCNGTPGGYGGGGGGGSFGNNCGGTRAGANGGFGAGGGGNAGLSPSGVSSAGFGGGNGGLNGQSNGGAGGGGGGGLGGAIFNHNGTVTLTNSTLSGNTAQGGDGGNALGTGNGGNGGDGVGGGVFNLNGTVTVTNCTSANNTAQAGSGGTANSGTAGTAGSGVGGGVYNLAHEAATGITAADANLTLNNTIVAYSTASNDVVNNQRASIATVTATTPNIVQTPIANVGGTVNSSGVSNVDPLLGPLSNNGGPTFTRALQKSSPAVDAGDNAAATSAGLTTDQRGPGFSRFQDSADADTVQTVDIGAFEAQASVEDISDKSTAEDTPLSFNFNVGDSASITSVTAASSNATLVPNDAGHLTVTGTGSTRTLNITPATDQTGTSTITVSVTSGSESMSDTFVLTVTEVNDAPVAVNDTLSSVAEDSGQRAVAFSTLTANDNKGAANESGQTLTVKTVSNPVGGTVVLDTANSQVLFTPAADFYGTASFDYTIEDDGTTNGAPDPKTSTAAATASFTVTEVNDAPTAVNDTLSNVAEDSGQRAVAFSTLTANDNKGPANESGQTLIVTTVSNPVGGTVVLDTPNSQVLFTPAANFYGPASFDYTIQDDGTTNGASDPKTSAAAATASFTVTAVADTPSVTDATTNEDTQTTTGLVISRNINDGAEVTHFKITNITNGTLFKNDGTTAIANNDVITYAEGQAGLKFTPAANSFANGSFQVQGATDSSGGGLSSGFATATITVTAVADTPSVTNATTNEDTQTTLGLVISRNINDGAEVTHFKITNITNGTLFKNDGTTAIANNDFITFAEGQAGLKFTPTANSFANGSFQVQGATDSSGGGLSSGSATATITVNPVADTPSVTNAATVENTQTISGLVISRNTADGAEVTHFKITSITNGTLFKNDGTTVIANNDFITFAEGNAGLKFTPSANSTANGSFQVQASVNATNGGLGGGLATATITVQAAPTFAIDDVTQNEGDAGTTVYTFTLTKTGATAFDAKVDYETANGSATEPTDYTKISPTTLVFLPGDASKQITVSVKGDTTVEPDEAFTVHLSNPVAAKITDADGTGTITNDDTDVSITAPPSSPVVEDGGPNLVYTFNRTGVTTGSITVNFSVGGTASFPSDYSQSGATTFSSTTGSVTMGDGVTTAAVTVDPATDTIYEAAETVILTVTSGTGYNPGTPVSASGTITNDDDPPTLAIGDRIASEGNGSGTTPFVFTVTRSGATQVGSTVHFATADGVTNAATGDTSCTGGADYISQTSTLTFPASGPGSTSQTITIAVCKDATVEPNETFLVELDAPTDATIADGEGRGTIQNDDSPGTVLVVNTTSDHAVGTCDPLSTGDCTLREAITAASGSAGGIIAINFAIPATDARHFYYKDDGVPNQVTNDVTHVLVTTAVDDASLPVDKDPDWPYSWWSILPTSNLPTITHSVIVGGYTQTGASANAATTGTNAILRIELNGTSAGASATGLNLNAGTSTVRGLVINRFTGDGLSLPSGNGTAAGNFIGTDVSGMLGLGNGGNGITCSGFSASIGGPTAAEVNLISGNTGAGISFSNSNSDLVLGNLIGTKANGTTALGNTGNGISLSGAGAGFNTIGGTQSTDGNTIANNGGDGVQVALTASVGNAIRGNSIFSNGTTSQHLGIDLATDGVTVNDAKDPDTGANNQQNFPIITSALVTGSTRTIKGTLNSKAGEIFDIDFYASTSCDASGNGEGQTYLGSITTDPTDTNGDVSFTFHPDASHEAGMTKDKIITATATSTGASFSTSELSACFAAADGSSGAGDIQFTSATYSGGEAAGPASITVTRVGGSNGSVTANFSTSDGTAQAPGDYTAVTNFPIPYADGETGDKVVTVTPFNDTTYEGNETVNLALSGTQIVGAPPSPGPPHAAVLTIVENDSVPSFAIDHVTHNEGNTGTTSFTFTVTKTGSTALSSSVDFTTQDGTATVTNNDYTVNTGTLSFAAGETTKTIEVLVTGDAINEATEAFTVHLSNPSGATISDADGTGTITNDDPQPTFTVANTAISEGGGNATVTVTKNGATDFTTSVHYATSDGSATAPADYTATSGDLTFAPGDTSMTFTVPIINDTFFEGDESFSVSLSAPSNATLGTPSSATVTINENDPAPVLQFSSATYGVGEAAGTVTITVTKTGATALNATVHYATSDGTAAAPGDYTSTAGDLTFAPGDTSMSFTVPIINDATFEGNESFSVTLSAPANATLGANNPATVTITDNDAAPTVQFSATNYNVNEGAGTATVTVTKTGATAFTATVHYATSDGTAAAPGDYTNTSGDLTFAPGETSKDFTVSITNDNVFEASESFNVTLSAPGNATLGTPSSATVTIADNDAQPTFQFSQTTYSAGEAAGNATLIVTKTGATSLSATVHFATSDGTAVAPGDYTAASGDLTFLANETSKQIQVPIVDDTAVENNETFTVTLTAPSGATLGSPSSASVTIVDNDTLPQVRWTSATYTADENSGGATLMVTRSGNDSGTVVVHYSTSDGSAKAGSDYTATSGDLTFLPGGPPEQTVTVPLINDNIPESTENFTVTLSAPSGGTIGTPSSATVSITDTDTAPSPTPTPTATPGPTAAQALNLSTRLKVETGDHAMIAGFIITGNGFKQVVLRGLGPSLAGFNIPDFLPDPVLELRRSNNSLIIRNNDWKDNQRGQIEGTPFEPKDDRESVIVATLQPGAYAAILTEKNDQTGVGLVEVYDTDPPSNVQMANISTRGFVRTDTKVMIGGFTLGGNSNSPRIVVRGLGPSLKKFFLTDLLADPTLELHNANGTPTIVNDNWQDDPVSAAQLITNNFAPEDPNEAAIFISLAPGPYTAILAGKGGSIGLGLVEIYNLQ